MFVTLSFVRSCVKGYQLWLKIPQIKSKAWAPQLWPPRSKDQQTLLKCDGPLMHLPPDHVVHWLDSFPLSLEWADWGGDYRPSEIHTDSSLSCVDYALWIRLGKRLVTVYYWLGLDQLARGHWASINPHLTSYPVKLK